MAYEFRAQEGVREAIARVSREQLDRALRALEEEMPEDPVGAVHAARKAVKKERALLRLIRGAMPAGQRRALNAELRDAARTLSAARDADVLVQSVDKMAERFAGQVPEQTFTAVRARFAEDQGAVPEGDIEQAKEAFRRLRTRLDEWELQADGWKAIRGGLARTYGDGRRGLRRLDGQASSQDWHEWRKRVKDLWYHLRVLSPVGGPAVRGQAEEAEALGELLGEEHDLAVLREALIVRAPELSVDTDALVALVEYRREQLQTQARHIGSRLYAERPQAFLRRMRRYWRAGRREYQAFQARHPAALADTARQPLSTR